MPLPFFSSESQTLNRRHCGYAQGPEVLCLQESAGVLPGGTPVQFILAQLTEGMALWEVKEERWLIQPSKCSNPGSNSSSMLFSRAQRNCWGQGLRAHGGSKEHTLALSACSALPAAFPPPTHDPVFQATGRSWRGQIEAFRCIFSMGQVTSWKTVVRENPQENESGNLGLAGPLRGGPVPCRRVPIFLSSVVCWAMEVVLVLEPLGKGTTGTMRYHQRSLPGVVGSPSNIPVLERQEN